MAFWEVFLIAVGGTGTALTVAGFLAKNLVGQFLTKELERYKAHLSHENGLALEAAKAELQQQAKQDDRRYAYAQILKRYQGPLMHAVYDLQSRLYNIIAQGLVDVYLVHGKEHERQYVINNTVFVIAQYFAWTEIIRRDIQFIDLNDMDKTKRLRELQDNIYSLWQTDKFHDSFMVWAGEQRAVGELMIVEHQDGSTCMGYAAFLKKLKEAQEPLFTKLQADVVGLSKNIVAAFPRLAKIQHALIDTLKHLDPNYLYFPEKYRKHVKFTMPPDVKV